MDVHARPGRGGAAGAAAKRRSLEPSPPAEPASNTLGFWSVLVAVAGLLTLGLLSPIALVMSLFALRERPQGRAVAGLVVSVAGLIVAALFGVGLVTGLITKLQHGTSAIALVKAMQAIERETAARGRRLTDEEGQTAVDVSRGFLHRPVRYRVLDDGNYGTGEYYSLKHAGRDGLFGTKDDDGIVGSASRPVLTDEK